MNANVSRRQSQNVSKLFKNFNILKFGDYYLESPWQMHSHKYKHAWYWLRKLWTFDNLGNTTILHQWLHQWPPRAKYYYFCQYNINMGFFTDVSGSFQNDELICNLYIITLRTKMYIELLFVLPLQPYV